MLITVAVLVQASNLERLVQEARYRCIYTEGLDQVLQAVVCLMRAAPWAYVEQINEVDCLIEQVGRTYTAIAEIPDRDADPDLFSRSIEPILYELSFIAGLGDLNALPRLVLSLEVANCQYRTAQFARAVYSHSFFSTTGEVNRTPPPHWRSLV